MIATLLAGLLAFGPADPVLPVSATCVDAAADTVAIGRETSRGWVIETSTADGPWLRVIGPIKREYDRICPRLSAAADGTAVVVSFSEFGDDEHQLAVRRPGGTFGTPTVLRSSIPVTTAAARGGRVAVLYRTGRTGSPTLLQLPPDGPPSRVAVPSAADGELFSLAPDGSTTLGAAPDGSFPIAMDASGRQLRGAFSEDGLRVQVGAEPPALVAPVYETYGVIGALAEDGAAVVIYHDQQRGLMAVDRAAGGAWSAPHPLPRGSSDDLLGMGIEPPSIPARVDIASSGRVVVAWDLADNGANVAVTGQAGGVWGRTAVLSSPSRQPGWPVVTGDRVLWIEPDSAHGPGPLRGARVGAPAPVDTRAPVYTLKLPPQVKATRKGHATIPFTVRCDEACDVFFDTEDPVDGYVARSLAAGERRTLRFRNRSAYVSGTHRVRFKLVVSDRAGNAHRRTVRVRVRVP
ncbi:hypothetical protein OJ997_18810 [Solirubrobacter phytolaccae]|uniref:Uncharacterized protein n=1 Tax=Solirubrobacter phytolaccae TaxID=1404360 RepID=A0A9X3NE20_9ACTN|nr:hypothetical protein [Solirubrobacter phytolaccae]MDA0182366.1 hypothetical protein [Solirubrobacter phytolaccae]